MSRKFWLFAIAAMSATGGYFFGLRYRDDASFMLPPDRCAHLAVTTPAGSAFGPAEDISEDPF